MPECRTRGGGRGGGPGGTARAASQGREGWECFGKNGAASDDLCLGWGQTGEAAASVAPGRGNEREGGHPGAAEFGQTEVHGWQEESG